MNTEMFFFPQLSVILLLSVVNNALVPFVL